MPNFYDKYIELCNNEKKINNLNHKISSIYKDNIMCLAMSEIIAIYK